MDFLALVVVGLAVAALVVVGLESASQGRGRIFAFRQLMRADNRNQG